MLRFLALFLVSANLCCAAPGVDIDTAASVYQAEGLREQVRISLGSMAPRMRRLFQNDEAAALDADQLAAVEAAAKQYFRVDVFEPPALAAMAAALDAADVRDILRFLDSPAGQHMVAADIGSARHDEATADRFPQGEPVPRASDEREALFDQILSGTHALDTAVDAYLTIARGLAAGTAIGSGRDPIAAQERVDRNADAAVRAQLAATMQEPVRRSLAWGYRELSTADLREIAAFLHRHAGERYVGAYRAAMDAGFEAMSRRCGERIGESWRELALASRAAAAAAAAKPASAASVASP
jgi:hypothetical protein